MEKLLLKDIDTRAPKDIDKAKTKKATEEILQELNELQNLLYAGGEHSLLIIFQGLDASGKDGLIKDVFTGINPLGIDVIPFKVPTEVELSHDFLWRIHNYTPPKGKIHVFNRSHYEDVLVTRVEKMIDDKVAKKRMRAINDFERLLRMHNNTITLKFYLHVSKEEQQARLQERMQNPAKMWKYNAGDKKVVEKRDEYIHYYEEVFDYCNETPWHIIPADQNWYKAHLVAQKIKETLEELDMKWPGMSRD
jgi:PPK2 family polyphosphate:nucleotide phosphotransferase